MTQDLAHGPLAAFAGQPATMIASANDRIAWRFVDFFAVTNRNAKTR